jgi:hypothetical protein
MPENVGRCNSVHTDEITQCTYATLGSQSSSLNKFACSSTCRNHARNPFSCAFHTNSEDSFLKNEYRRTLLSGPGLTRIDEEDRLLYVGGDVLVPGVDIMNQFSAVIYG